MGGQRKTEKLEDRANTKCHGSGCGEPKSWILSSTFEDQHPNPIGHQAQARYYSTSLRFWPMRANSPGRPCMLSYLSARAEPYPASPPIVERIHDVVSFLCPVRAFPFVRVGELSKDIGLTVKCWGKGLNNDIGKELLA